MTSERLSVELFDLQPLPSGLARRFLAVLTRCLDRERQRNALAQFDARMLRDIGITETDVWHETQLPPWLRVM